MSMQNISIPGCIYCCKMHSIRAHKKEWHSVCVRRGAVRLWWWLKDHVIAKMWTVKMWTVSGIVYKIKWRTKYFLLLPLFKKKKSLCFPPLIFIKTRVSESVGNFKASEVIGKACRPIIDSDFDLVHLRSARSSNCVWLVKVDITSFDQGEIVVLL